MQEDSEELEWDYIEGLRPLQVNACPLKVRVKMMQMFQHELDMELEDGGPPVPQSHQELGPEAMRNWRKRTRL